MTTRFTIILTIADKAKLTGLAARSRKTFSQYVREQLGISQLVAGKKKSS